MHYFPILKAKQGEVQALKELRASTKAVIYPILQVPPPNMSRPARGQVSVLVPHTQATIKTCINRLKGLAGMTCFVDPKPGQLSPLLINTVVQTLATLPAPLYPVIELEGSDDYLAAYRAVIGEPEVYCLRLSIEASVDAGIVATIQRALRHYRLAPEQGVLLLDIGDVSPTVANIAVYGANAIAMFKRTARMPFQEQVLGSGAFPNTVPATSPSWTALPYPRKDLQMWRTVHAQVPVSYGDYAIANPNNEPMPSYSGSPKARYTHTSEFHVIKGVGVAAPPDTMHQQYHRISRTLSALHIYSGPSFSWGDARIDSCCDPASTSNGNLTTWVGINTNHHLEFIANSLLLIP